MKITEKDIERAKKYLDNFSSKYSQLDRIKNIDSLLKLVYGILESGYKHYMLVDAIIAVEHKRSLFPSEEEYEKVLDDVRTKCAQIKHQEYIDETNEINASWDKFHEENPKLHIGDFRSDKVYLYKVPFSTRHKRVRIYKDNHYDKYYVEMGRNKALVVAFAHSIYDGRKKLVEKLQEFIKKYQVKDA